MILRRKSSLFLLVFVCFWTLATISSVFKKSETHPDDAIIHHEEEKRTRPWFVLHVGLHKTGTTLIQSFMRRQLKNLLEQDLCQPLTLFDAPVRDIRHCFLRANFDPKNMTCYQPSLHRLMEIGREGKNIIVSQEDFSAFDFGTEQWKTLFHTLEKHFRVRVIVYYRRHFERVLSVRNEIYKWIKTPGERQNRMGKWPVDGGTATPGMAEYFDSTAQQLVDFMTDTAVRKTEVNRIFNVIRGLGAIQSSPSTQIIVRNYHCADVLEDFFCHAMNETPLVCEFVRRRRGKQGKVNPSVNDHDYDIIAVEAKRRGLVQEGVTRLKVKMEIRRRQEKILNLTVGDLPKVCLSAAQQEALRRLSYEIESMVMPSMLGTHDDDFEKTVQKFCSVDAPLVLEDENWQSFIRQIQPGGKP